MKARSVLSAFFVMGSFFAIQPALSYPEEKTDFLKQSQTLPSVILAFQKMNFDDRMIYQEFLRLKSGQTLFANAVKQFLSLPDQEVWDDRVSQSLAIVYLGRPTTSLDTHQSLPEVAQACGLKRISQLMQFYAKNPPKGSYFLDDKDAFYRTALSAEARAFDEAGWLFPIDDVISFKTHLMHEEWHFDKRHHFDGNPYLKHISKQAQKQLIQLQKAQSSYAHE